jgi:DNA-binding MarR family transcriptional regulator
MKNAINYGALADFRYEIRRFLNFSEWAAHSAGIEPQQHQALLAIKGRAREVETTISTLAERLQVRHHTAVELTDRLEKKGWIHRSRGHDDARKVNLLLTRRGEKLLETLSASHRNELRTAGPRLLGVLESVLAHDGRPRRRRARAKRGK